MRRDALLWCAPVVFCTAGLVLPVLILHSHGLAEPVAVAPINETSPPTSFPEAAASALARLALPRGLYRAGLPRFPHVFMRDTVLSALLLGAAGDGARAMPIVEAVLRHGAESAGTRADELTGEEVGKIFHELPSSRVGSKLTAFSAIDTTPLYVIAACQYAQYDNESGGGGGGGVGRLGPGVRAALAAAVEYIRRHVGADGLYCDRPPWLAGGRMPYALGVTYWKDSALPGRPSGRPLGPVCYTVAHVMAMEALRCAEETLGLGGEVNGHSGGLPSVMAEALRGQLYEAGRGLVVGKDDGGVIPGRSSDGLFALWWLREGDLDEAMLNTVVDASICLETPLGYRGLCEDDAGGVGDRYHISTVWPFEQAFIYDVASRRDMPRVAAVAARALQWVIHHRTFPERLDPARPGRTAGVGPDPQLWSVAAGDMAWAVGVTP